MTTYCYPRPGILCTMMLDRNASGRIACCSTDAQNSGRWNQVQSYEDLSTSLPSIATALMVVSACCAAHHHLFRPEPFLPLAFRATVTAHPVHIEFCLARSVPYYYFSCARLTRICLMHGMEAGQSCSSVNGKFAGGPHKHLGRWRMSEALRRYNEAK